MKARVLPALRLLLTALVISAAASKDRPFGGLNAL